MPYGKRKMYELYYKHLRGQYLPLTHLADGWGLSRRLLVRDFKRWCDENGLNPFQFYHRGYQLTGYWVPKEFVEWWAGKILPQYQKTGHARESFNWGAVKAKKPSSLKIMRTWEYLVGVAAHD